jgi:hypothetical protein
MKRIWKWFFSSLSGEGMDKSKFNDPKEWKKFGIGLGILLAAAATVQFLKGHSLNLWLYGAGFLAAIAGIAVPILVKPVFILFSYLGVVLGWFSTRVILVLVFFLLLTPIALIMKLAGKKFMPMGKDGNLKTYWIDRNHDSNEARSFENQY